MNQMNLTLLLSLLLLLVLAYSLPTVDSLASKILAIIDRIK
ncbi:hypothetical protein Cylst_5143 [Cylindrospermum stagnale PCC 7417]|uniref:Uncharacterized protein n=1 Tax=Cylindrospermum stagnale PCC 7417 TaxID=56107 RepID=K9X547_9NOST|nr:hypothetical protein Cylst_5143 [Cylindrospermum stagnale PCC 7417]